MNPGLSTQQDDEVRALTMRLAVVLPVIFLGLGLWRAYPFVDDVRLPAIHADDWHTYKILAVSVLRGGLSMPGVQSSYTGLPHGFLYIYFLALVFAIAGVNSAYVYIVQSLVTGLSVSVTYVAVRRHLTARGGLAFLLGLAALMYVDVFRSLAFKLLSENLYFLIAPLLFVFLFRAAAGEPHQARDSFLAGVMLGLVVLARPSFTGAMGAVVGVLIMAAAADRSRIGPAVLLVAGIMLVMSGLALRNVTATGHVTFDLITDTFDWLKPWQLPFRQAAALLRTRALFIVGYTRPLAPAYRLRLYWTALWLAWAAYPVIAVVRRRRLALWEWLAYAFVVGYIAPLWLVAGDLASYGGRMVIVVLPLLLVSTVRLFAAVDHTPSRLSGPSAVADVRY